MASTAAAAPALEQSPLDVPLRQSKLIAPAPAARLQRLGIRTVGDMLFHLPRRYDDFSRPMTLRELRDRPPEGPVSATVEVVELHVEQGFRRRVQRTVARLRDATGEGEAVWFGRRYIERRLAPGMTVALSGKVELRGWLPRFVSPEFGAAGEDALHAGRIVPVYRLTEGITAAWLRQRMRDVLDAARPQIEEYLPAAVREARPEAATPIGEAIEWIHFPAGFPELERAIARLAFDELFALQLGMVARSRQRGQESAPPIEVTPAQLARAIGVVEQVIGAQVAARQAAAKPDAAAAAGTDEASATSATVTLTADQRAAIEQVVADLASGRPMMRLLQGDVGSGKTAVAAMAMAFVADAHGQAALLAPTDLLARQHAATLGRLLEPLGHDVTLLTGSLSAAARREALELLGAPVDASIEGRSRGRIAVGTHALVQQAVAFAGLRLVVVDEQHRFGVSEREALAAKGPTPHVLLMTATPIPRTLGQIVHADLDVSDLRTPPAGRQRTVTGIRQTSELLRRHDGSPGALPLLAREIAAGQRGFVVVPLVEEDEGSAARSVEEAAVLIRSSWPEALELAGLPPGEPAIEIVHGQLRAVERDARMERFRRGEAQILVGTTVVEVGVDVPEATVMIILDADRFGVAQLHQLRGRVGRGEAQSYCVLVSERYPRAGHVADEEQAAVRARLDALAETTDGFVLAEMDLAQRREGELLGLSQSGLPPLRIASLQKLEHRELSVEARRLAERLLDERGRLPPEARRLERELAAGWLKRVGAGEVLSAVGSLDSEFATDPSSDGLSEAAPAARAGARGRRRGRPHG